MKQRGSFFLVRVFGVGFQIGPALLVPGIQFGLISVDRALFFNLEAMNRKVRGFLPALNSSDLTPEVSGDFLPGVQSAIGRIVAGARGRSGDLVTHGGNLSAF
jgi:hypothetical protein